MGETLVIDPQYYGFPGVGFGGYVSGLLASFVGGAAQVTLRSPPPLARAMRVTRIDADRVQLHDGETLVAQAVAGPPEAEVPDAVSYEEAARASKRFPGWRAHAFPMCFTCGIDREEGEGLRIFPGALDDRPGAAAPWVPHPDFADSDGVVRPEFVWSALDCPTYWGMYPDGRGPRGEGSGVLTLTTARLHTSLLGPVLAGERYVVLGWPVSADGRKFIGGAGVFGEDAALRAVCHGTWLPLPTRQKDGSGT